MSESTIVKRFGSWTGLAGGALVWAANTQAGQILPVVDCVGSMRVAAIISFAGAVLALVAGFASSFFARIHPEAASDYTDRFIGYLSLLAALLFTYALALQGLAALVLSGCER